MPRRKTANADAGDDGAARKKKAKYQRARVRNFIFTVGPNKLTRGRVAQRHLANDVLIHEIVLGSPLWPAAFDNLRIAHVSDFHLGELLPIDRALQVIEQIALQQPDFVACTGDVVDLHLSTGAGRLLQAMADVRAPMGTALVLGNHDELHCSETLAGMAIETGLLVLRDEAARLTRNGHELNVAGTRWAHTAAQCAKCVDRACSDRTDLLLSHNPKSFIRAAEIAVPLTLAGHTHGGQIAMKNRPTTNLAMHSRFNAGVYTRGPSRLYVTPGVGAWFPLRVNCPAEVAMITMRHQDADEVDAEE
jgi:predicted MPP superfamily phosphohydrolase